MLVAGEDLIPIILPLDHLMENGYSSFVAHEEIVRLLFVAHG